MIFIYEKESLENNLVLKLINSKENCCYEIEIKFAGKPITSNIAAEPPQAVP